LQSSDVGGAGVLHPGNGWHQFDIRFKYIALVTNSKDNACPSSKDSGRSDNMAIGAGSGFLVARNGW